MHVQKVYVHVHGYVGVSYLPVKYHGYHKILAVLQSLLCSQRILGCMNNMLCIGMHYKLLNVVLLCRVNCLLNCSSFSSSS